MGQGGGGIFFFPVARIEFYLAYPVKIFIFKHPVFFCVLVELERQAHIIQAVLPYFLYL